MFMNSKSQKKKKGFHFKNERTGSTIIICTVLVFFMIAVMMNLTPVISLVMAALSAAACAEVIKAVGSRSKLLIGLAVAADMGYVLSVGFAAETKNIGVWLSLYAIILLSLTVFDHKKITFIHAMTAFFSSAALSYAFSCLIRLNGIYLLSNQFIHYDGIYLVALGFACAWLTDSFAYLVGKRFGKHKMCPEISPKKTIEGAVGGVVVAALLNVFILFCFDLIGMHFWQQQVFGDSSMKYLYIIPISVVLSCVSMVGDLAASVLKRNVGIKDFSNILPGHGGIMDRFDSWSFVFPVLYAIVRLFFVK